jgi:hypothetical protein
MLTKSDLQSYLQCRRKLWLEHNRTDLESGDEDSTARRRAMDGDIVGDRARAQLGKDFIWPPHKDSLAEAAVEAKSLLTASPALPAVEVPLVYDDLYARADALIPDHDAYVLRETKASTFPLKKDKRTPDAPDKHHVDDLAIQAWVMAGAGLPMARAELNLLDSQWRYPGNDDYEGLFRQLDASEQVAERLKSVPNWLKESRKIVAGEQPQVTTGRHCNEPYACQFHDFCVGLEPPPPEHPIELLPDKAGKDLARKLRESKGYDSILQPAAGELTGKQANLYLRMQQAHRTSQAVRAAGAAEVIAALPYPRYYFDFEGIDLPVPRWPGVRPYEQIPFQWSCHIESAAGVFQHAEFLDLTGDDPSVACIEKMIETIDPDGDGPIFVYFATYERGRLNELAIRHPGYAKVVREYVDRIVDLHPLVKAHFYHPAMEGSFSIKKVLPVVAPDLDYAKLDEVQEGTGAQVAYIEAALDRTTAPDRKLQLGQTLRIYCRQDTWAMVEVTCFLSETGRPVRPDGM